DLLSLVLLVPAESRAAWREGFEFVDEDDGRRLFGCFIKQRADPHYAFMDVNASDLRWDDLHEVVPQLLGKLSRDVSLSAARWAVEQDSVWYRKPILSIRLRIADWPHDLAAQQLLQRMHAPQLCRGLVRSRRAVVSAAPLKRQ